MELRFNLNGMVELERRCGGDLEKAMQFIRRGKHLPMAIAAFTRHLTPAPEKEEIREALKQRGAELLYRNQILEGFALPYFDGVAIGEESLPERYCGFRLTPQGIELVNQRWPEPPSSHLYGALRFAVWACLGESNPGLTEEDVGREIAPLHVWPLRKAHARAMREWAKENGIPA